MSETTRQTCYYCKNEFDAEPAQNQLGDDSYICNECIEGQVKSGIDREIVKKRGTTRAATRKILESLGVKEPPPDHPIYQGGSTIQFVKRPGNALKDRQEDSKGDSDEGLSQVAEDHISEEALESQFKDFLQLYREEMLKENEDEGVDKRGRRIIGLMYKLEVVRSAKGTPGYKSRFASLLKEVEKL